MAVRGNPPVPEVFVNSRAGELSRWGVAHILRKHVAAARKLCPSMQRKRVSPHVLRHTCAMTILRATNDLRKVSLWLGHSDMGTTEVYVRADPSEKLESVEAITPPKLGRGRFEPTDKLLALSRVTRYVEWKTARTAASRVLRRTTLHYQSLPIRQVMESSPLPAATGTARSVRPSIRRAGSPGG